MNEDEIEQATRRVFSGVKGFAAEMRAAGIHVGLGSNPRCVTCGGSWPCASAAPAVGS